jgi:hypothetical protein
MWEDDSDESGLAREGAQAGGNAASTPLRAPPASVLVHIEELVIDGLAPEDRHRLSETIERELTRLLNEHGIPGTLGESRDMAYLDSAVVHLRPNATPEVIGVEVAQAVYGGFEQGANTTSMK